MVERSARNDSAHAVMLAYAQGADLARSAERFNNVASAGTVVFNLDGTQPTSIRNWTNTQGNL